MFSDLPAYIITLLEQLRRNGFEAFLVGGCVRDTVLGIQPHDYDITTNARPEQIIRIFGAAHCSCYGRAYGTVCVHDDAHHFAEITTYRTESDYRDYRHPHEVRFADCIAEDLCRRDFTCNAMAWSEETGLLDLYHGREDLERHTLRCVGVPLARFREDALRILRAMRFCAKSGLHPDTLTHAAMLGSAFRLQSVSAERIYSELCNMLMGRHITEVLLAYPEILAVRIPEILPCIAFTQHSRYHDFTVWEHTARAVGNAPEHLVLRLTMLFHDLAKPACFRLDARGGHFRTHPEESAGIADAVLTRLKADNATKKAVCQLVELHRDVPVTMPQVQNYIGILGYEQFSLLLQVLETDRISKLHHQTDGGERIRQAAAMAQQCRAEHRCCCIKDLSINGNDVKQLGYQGRAIGRKLSYALDGVIAGACANTKEALLAYIQEPEWF